MKIMGEFIEKRVKMETEFSVGIDGASNLVIKEAGVCENSFTSATAPDWVIGIQQWLFRL